MKDLTLEKMCQHYLAAKTRENCSRRTLDLYDYWLTRWRQFLQEDGFSGLLQDLDLQAGQRFSDHLHSLDSKYSVHAFAGKKMGGLSSSTIHQAVRILRGFANWLCQRGYVDHHILQDLELPRIEKRVIQILTDEELGTILGCLNRNSELGARNYALLVLGLDTGLRQGEMVNLRLQYLDMNWRQLKVDFVGGKGRKERQVPFGQVAEEALREYIDLFRPDPYYPDDDFVFLSNSQTQMSRNSVVQLMSRLSKQSGVGRLHCHLLRHTFAVNYLVNGGDLVTLQMILGHADIETTRIYLQLAQTHVTLQHNRFSPMDKLDPVKHGQRRRGRRSRKGSKSR